MFHKLLGLPKAIASATKHITLLPVAIFRRPQQTNEWTPTQQVVPVAGSLQMQGAFLQYFNALLTNSINHHHNLFRAVMCLSKDIFMTTRRTDPLPAEPFCNPRPAGQCTPMQDVEPVVKSSQPEEARAVQVELDVDHRVPEEAEISKGGPSAKLEPGPPPPPIDLRCGTSRNDSKESDVVVTPRNDNCATENNGTSKVQARSSTKVEDMGRRESPKPKSSSWGLLFGDAPRQKCAPLPENIRTANVPSNRRQVHRRKSIFDSYCSVFSMGTFRGIPVQKYNLKRKVFSEVQYVRSRKRNRP